MTGKSLGMIVGALVALGAQAQTSSGSMDQQRGSSASSMAPAQQAPSYRSMPSRPSGPSGPATPGSALTSPDASSTGVAASGIDSTSIGGSGSAGVTAMGGGMAADNSAAGSGLMTDCPLGTSRKMGLCVPYGQTRKKQP